MSIVDRINYIISRLKEGRNNANVALLINNGFISELTIIRRLRNIVMLQKLIIVLLLAKNH